MSKIESFVQKTLRVPFNTIFVDPEENASRIASGKLKDIPQLAESIKTSGGLIEPLTVTNGGDEKHPFNLAAGYRRAAALELLHWGSKEVDVVVVAPERARVINLVENICRAGLSPLEKAWGIHLLVEGFLPDHAPDEGSEEEIVAMDKKEAATLLALSQSTLGNFLRIGKKLDLAVYKKIKAKDVAVHTLFSWISLEPEAQMKACEDWLEEQAAADTDDGPKKRNRKKKDEEKAGRPSSKALKQDLAVLAWLQHTAKNQRDKDFAQARADGLSYALGLKKRSPVSADERREFEKAHAPSEDEAAE